MLFPAKLEQKKSSPHTLQSGRVSERTSAQKREKIPQKNVLKVNNMRRYTYNNNNIAAAAKKDAVFCVMGPARIN